MNESTYLHVEKMNLKLQDAEYEVVRQRHLVLTLVDQSQPSSTTQSYFYCVQMKMQHTE